VTQRRWPCLVALTAAAVGLAGCLRDDGSTTGVLLDGTPVREVPVALEGVEETTVLTRTTVSDVASLEPGSAARACIDLFGDAQVEGSAVLRVGLESESVTFREAAGRALLGCANGSGPREANRRWCGSAYGLLSSRRLRDPRLDIGCTTTEGRPVGFAWIEVSERTSYVAVDEGAYVEVYDVAANLPVRVATVAGVEPEGSRATFELSEHDAEGRLLRKDRLEAVVAG
jgi:hypothetical protein